MFDNNDAMLDRLRALSIDLVVVDCHALMDHAYLIAHSLGVPWVTLTGAVQPCNVRVPYAYLALVRSQQSRPVFGENEFRGKVHKRVRERCV